MKNILIVFAIMFLAACSRDPIYQTETLPTGKSIKVIKVSKILFTEGSPALMLNYQTDLPIGDVSALTKEADEIWLSFQDNVEDAGFSIGAISASAPQKGLIIKTSKSHNFVYKKGSNGEWSRSDK